MKNRIKKSTIHTVIKSLSPKREIISPKKGCRTIPRSITPKALEYITNHINQYIESIIIQCEQSLKEINENPNSYYQQHRYDFHVVKKAIDKMKGKSM
jgi:hypothetical protein